MVDRGVDGMADPYVVFYALLMPRESFTAECRVAMRETRLNWGGLASLKFRWGVSKAAIVYRGRQLGVFSEEQARAGYIGLKRRGEAIQETEDASIQHEEPEVVGDSLALMQDTLGIPLTAVARRMNVRSRLLDQLLSRAPESGARVGNVVNLFSAPHRQLQPG